MTLFVIYRKNNCISGQLWTARLYYANAMWAACSNATSACTTQNLPQLPASMEPLLAASGNLIVPNSATQPGVLRLAISEGSSDAVNGVALDWYPLDESGPAQYHGIQEYRQLGTKCIQFKLAPNVGQQESLDFEFEEESEMAGWITLLESLSLRLWASDEPQGEAPDSDSRSQDSAVEDSGTVRTVDKAPIASPIVSEIQSAAESTAEGTQFFTTLSKALKDTFATSLDSGAISNPDADMSAQKLDQLIDASVNTGMGATGSSSQGSQPVILNGLDLPPLVHLGEILSTKNLLSLLDDPEAVNEFLELMPEGQRNVHSLEAAFRSAQIRATITALEEAFYHNSCDIILTSMGVAKENFVPPPWSSVVLNRPRPVDVFIRSLVKQFRERR